MTIPIQQDKDTSAKWMPCPKINTEFPGLAYICALDKLIVAEQNDSFSELIGRNSAHYTIFNKQGEKVFLAVQDRGYRKFDLKIFNYYGNEVIKVKKAFELCFKRIRVWAPPGNYVGSVEQVKCRRIFLVKNEIKKVVLKIKSKGHCMYIFDKECENIVGQEWSMAKALGAKKCGIIFPIDMSIGEKAVLLGASFLIGCLRR